MKRAIPLVTVLILVTSGLQAQIEARQGKPKIEMFESPMILDVPIAINETSFLEEGKRFTAAGGLSNYVCDNVSFTSISVERGKVDKGQVPVKLTFFLKNVPGHDKLVSVRFQFMQNGEPISDGVRVRDIDVEEGRFSVDKATLLVKQDALDPASDPPVLNITLEAVDH